MYKQHIQQRVQQKCECLGEIKEKNKIPMYTDLNVKYRAQQPAALEEHEAL